MGQGVAWHGQDTYVVDVRLLLRYFYVDVLIACCIIYCIATEKQNKKWLICYLLKCYCWVTVVACVCKCVCGVIQGCSFVCPLWGLSPTQRIILLLSILFPLITIWRDKDIYYRIECLHWTCAALLYFTCVYELQCCSLSNTADPKGNSC